jgi:hypothetical protein
MQAKNLEQLQKDQQQLNFPEEIGFKPLSPEELNSLPTRRYIEYRQNLKNNQTQKPKPTNN